MVNSQSWNEIKNCLKIGTKLTGVVTKHFPFGIFVDLPGIQFTGLVQITDFSDEGIMTPSDYPMVGSSVDVVVLGFKETGQQIWLSMKPSQLVGLQ
jgi:ribosomal protein S1